MIFYCFTLSSLKNAACLNVVCLGLIFFVFILFEF